MAQDVQITTAGEAQRIAEQLIPEHHEHLAEAKITYLFTNKERKRADKVVLGTAQKASDLLRYLTGGSDEGADFILLFGIDEWRRLTREQQRALVDHELCHCIRKQTISRSGEVKESWGLRGHDIEEFAEIVERHGLWKRDVKEFAEVVEQLRLPA